jgi:hypothetical protein
LEGIILFFVDWRQMGSWSAYKRSPNTQDIMRFFAKIKDRIFNVCAPLYAQGLSFREIERQTGFVKSTIKKTLNSRAGAKVSLQEFSNVKSRNNHGNKITHPNRRDISGTRGVVG